MSTFITVSGGSGALVTRVKQVQQANREAQLQRENDTLLQAQLAAEFEQAAAVAERPLGGNPDTSIDRRPAAQRVGAVAAVRFQWGTYERVPNTNYRASYLTVSTATRSVTLDWRGVDLPGAELFSALLPVQRNTALFIWTGDPDPWIPMQEVTGDPASTGYVPIDPANITKVVLVTPTTLREITPPAGLAEKMRAWGTLAYFEDQWALTRHFGMLQPSGIYNGTLSYWTPAVFAGLNGTTVSASQTERSNYAYMRTNFFQAAPSFFLATEDFAAPSYNPLLRTWRQTNYEPETVTTPVPAGQLRKASSGYNVKISSNEEGDNFYYSWDWNKPAQCRSQLLTLGFEPEDLVP